MSTAPVGETPRYRRWAKRGQRHSSTGGWINIALTGFRLFYKRPHTQRIVWLSSAFVVGNCIVFYLLSLLETLAGTSEAEGIIDFLHGVLGVDLSGATQLSEFRPVLWRTVYLFTFKAELFVVLIILAQLGGRLIARDLKARALPIYFARPITPLTYLLGKWMVAAAFIGLVTLVPNLISLVVGTLLTGGLGGWSETLRLAGELTAVGLTGMVLGGVVILALSSLSPDSRFVTVGWVSFCLLPLMAQAIITGNVGRDRVTGFLGSISPRDDLVMVSEWLLGIRDAWAATPLPLEAFERSLGAPVGPIYPAIVLGAITLSATVVAFVRVRHFSRAAAQA